MSNNNNDRRTSERHIKYQIRLANLLREYDYFDVAIEKPVPYTLPLQNGTGLKIRYRLDVYGRKKHRKIAIEIDGHMGHKSARAFAMDGLRSRRIQEAYGPIDIYRFTFKQLARWTHEEIAEEMNL